MIDLSRVGLVVTLVGALVVTLVGAAACERRPPEPPAPPAEPPRPREPPPPSSALAAIDRSRAEPAAEAGRDACALLPEVAVRVFADIDSDTRVERESSALAGLDTCRYRWRKREAAQIRARNRERVERSPNLLAAVARRSGSLESLESSEAELRLSIYPPRSGTPSMLARGFEMAHAGEEVIAALGDQAAYDRARRLLTVRRGNRTFELLVKALDDEASTRALATRIARDVLSRWP